MLHIVGEKAYTRKILRSSFANCNKVVVPKAFTGDSSDRTRFKKLQTQNRAYFKEKNQRQNTCS